MTTELKMKPIAIFITYTMLNPIVGGAFFRALRLACELERRGWAPVICNHGPELSDPKIEAARNKVQFVQLIEAESGRDSAAAQRYFKSFKPAVIIMGEGPISTMKVYYEGAKRLK